MFRLNRQTFFFVFAGLLLAGASLFPETAGSLAAGFAFAGFFALALLRSSTLLRDSWVCGVVFYAAAFYWLPATIQLFGGFPRAAAYLLFALFCAFSALQFLLCAWLYRFLRPIFQPALLALPLAWLAAEAAFPRMFPWALGHSLAAWPQLTVLAEFGGVYPLGSLVIWCAAAAASLPAAIAALPARRPLAACAAAFAAAAAAFAFGAWRCALTQEELAASPEVTVGLIQGNLSTKQKGDVRQLDVNIERYRALSDEATAAGAEILFWPESVMNVFTPSEIQRVRGTKYDPFPEIKVPLLYGGLSVKVQPVPSPGRGRGKMKVFGFNTAFGVDPQGAVQGSYNKRVLMPFGEYLPFAETFPYLRTLSPHSGDLTPGESTEPIVLAVQRANQTLDVRSGALICYEDLLPSLSREAVGAGANLLVNLTNDAWYGDTAAPYQHHLLALWRAVETRRYMLRVTNTGYTAVVDPLGRTVKGLPVFVEDQLVARVKLLSGRTVYSQFGDTPVWLIIIGALGLALLRKRRAVS